MDFFFFWLLSICVSKLRRGSIKLRFPDMIWKIAYVSQRAIKKRWSISYQITGGELYSNIFNFNDLLEYRKHWFPSQKKIIFIKELIYIYSEKLTSIYLNIITQIPIKYMLYSCLVCFKFFQYKTIHLSYSEKSKLYYLIFFLFKVY